MTFSANELNTFLVRRTNEVWSETQAPYFLARVQPELMVDGKSYRDVTGDSPLSIYAERIPGVRLVRHPHQKAKIGLVPENTTFEFSEALELRSWSDSELPRSSETLAVRSRRRKSEHVVMDFLQLLARLDCDDLEGFSIPAKVIAKLLRE